MAQKPEGRLKLNLDDSKFVQKLKAGAKNVAIFSAAINQSLEIAGKAWSVISGALSRTIELAQQARMASAKQQKAEVSFLAAARRRQKFSDEEFVALKRNLNLRQQAIGFGDEEQLAIATQLSAMGVRNEALGDALDKVVALNTVTGNVTASSKLYARVLNGEVSALKRYGITASTVAGAQDQLNQLQAVAVAQSKLQSTRIEVLAANQGDFVEVLGDGINKSGALTGAIDALGLMYVELSEIMSDPAVQDAVNTIFAIMIKGAALTIEAFLGLGKVIRDFINFELEAFHDAKRFLGLETEDFVPITLGDDLFAVGENLADRLRAGAKRGSEEIIIPELRLTPGGAGAAGRGNAIDLEAQEAEARRATLNSLHLQEKDRLESNRRIAEMRREMFERSKREDAKRLEADEAAFKKALETKDRLSQEAHERETDRIRREGELRKQNLLRFTGDLQAATHAGIRLYSLLSASSESTARKQFEVQKRASLAQAFVNLGAGMVRALADHAFPYSLFVAGTVLAAGAGTIAQIAGRSFEGGGSTPSVGGASVATPAGNSQLDNAQGFGDRPQSGTPSNNNQQSGAVTYIFEGAVVGANLRGGRQIADLLEAAGR